MDHGLWCKLFALRLPARVTKADCSRDWHFRQGNALFYVDEASLQVIPSCYERDNGRQRK